MRKCFFIAQRWPPICYRHCKSCFAGKMAEWNGARTSSNDQKARSRMKPMKKAIAGKFLYVTNSAGGGLIVFLLFHQHSF
jgi:hypothetical protein